MSAISFPGLNSEGDIKQLIDRLEAFSKDFNFTMSGNLSTVNAREFGGWLVGKTNMMSKDGDVGMSTADTAGDDIRFWAGDGLTATPPWLVRKSGYMVASSGKIGGWDLGTTGLSGSGTITGGTVQTGAVNTNRIEMSAGKFSGYTSSNLKTGLYFDINTVPGTGIADVHLYHNDSQMLTFYDNITNFSIRPGAGASSMILGVAGKTTFANGAWVFSGAASGTVYVSATSGGVANIPISFTSGLRTS